MEDRKRGGKREGSGRPKNENKAYSIQCHPSKIKELREYAKNISKINEKQYCLSKQHSYLW